LLSERRKPEYGAQPGPVALLERLADAVRAGDLKRLALILCRCPADALEGSQEAAAAGDSSSRIVLPSPLHVAASAGQSDCCVLLLQRNAPPDSRDSRGRTPLMIAIERGHVECACTLLPHCTDLKGVCHAKQSALHRAASYGMGALVSRMLRGEVDVASVDGKGRTALHLACVAGEPIILMQLVNSGEEGRHCLDLADAYGCTPALAAARGAYRSSTRRCAQLHCVAACLLLGADASATSAAANPSRRQSSSATPAASAAGMGVAATSGSHPPTPGSSGASSSTASMAHTAAPASASLSERASPTTAIHASSSSPSSSRPSSRPLPLHFYVAALGSTDLLMQLIERLLRAPPPPTSATNDKAPPPLRPHRPLDARGCNGLAALHFAAAHGQLESVRLLLAHGAAPDEPDESGALPSDHALRGLSGCQPGEGHAECHQLLLRHLAR
jgi:ankyrin repeat protein